MTATACPVAASLTSHLRDQDAMDAADAAFAAAYDQAMAKLKYTHWCRVSIEGDGVVELMCGDELVADEFLDKVGNIREWMLEKLDPRATAMANDECERRKFDGDI